MRFAKLNIYDKWDLEHLDGDFVKSEIDKRGFKLSWIAKKSEITNAQLSYILKGRYKNRNNKAKLFETLKELGIPIKPCNSLTTNK
jgi:predicted transcriptional regulator